MKKSIHKISVGVCCVLLLFGGAACGEERDGGEELLTPAITNEITPEPTAEPTEAPKATATPKPTATPEPTPNLLEGQYIKDAALEHGFTFGTVMNHSQLKSTYYAPMVKAEFQSITAGNEMKAYSLLDQAASKKDPNGMPAMNYRQGDAIVAFAQENGLGVRGHVLVWDNYMSDWFFREGYTNDGAYVDKETARARLKYYIEEVVTHFETEYPGVVYCWDVVNEAVGDGGDFKADDPRRVRSTRNGSENKFYSYVGEDYVEFSFACAKETVEKLQAKNPEVSVDLFYNDYNTFYDAKRDGIIALVESINSYVKNADGTYKKLCDGIGMQSYIGGYGQQAGCMNASDITKIEKAIRMFHEIGVDVHVTEMAVRNYEESRAKKHAEFFGKLFAMYKKLNAEEHMISNISVWGICDNPIMSKTDYSYAMNGPYCGLFNSICKRKDSYYEVLKALKTEVSESEDESKPTAVPEVTNSTTPVYEPAKLEDNGYDMTAAGNHRAMEGLSMSGM